LTSFFIDEHGCAKNQVDGELLIVRLIKLGYIQTFDPSAAGVIIINSCGFIESAKKESLNAVCEARKLYPQAKILLTGCLAQRYAETFRKELPETDGIFGNGNLDRISEIIAPLLEGERPVLAPPQKGICSGDRMMLLSYRGSAYVKITEGCSNHCTFCAIPVIRGELRSRSADDIVLEIKKLISEGIFEINLIGQDLAAYGTGTGDNVFGDGRSLLPDIDGTGCNHGTKQKSALARLLEYISALSGVFRVRLLYIHPDHFNRDILSVMKKDSRLLPYFDIPFQSGDDELIRAMNRRGTAAEYERLVRDIRTALPGAVIRTTFLTGFPGETEERAEHTRLFLKKIQSDWSGCFPYSREEDTPAYVLKERVAQKEAKKRAECLEALQSDITAKCLALRIGKQYDVLVEETISGDEGLAIGRAWFQAPDVDGTVVIRYDRHDDVQNNAVKPGRVVHVGVDGVNDVDLDSFFVCDALPDKKNPGSNLHFVTEV
jgi:ribosomal protein S12 methylthiotransferase